MAQDDDNAFDENGILRDRRRYRIPMHARDSQAPMIRDGTDTDDPFVLHRPGWRIASGGSERDVQIRDSRRKLVEDARAEYVNHVANAWKGGRSTD